MAAVMQLCFQVNRRKSARLELRPFQVGDMVIINSLEVCSPAFLSAPLTDACLMQNKKIIEHHGRVFAVTPMNGIEIEGFYEVWVCSHGTCCGCPS